MAGVAEKARFYLERAVPQLRKWEEKEIFTKDEIRNLVSKRSAYEHRVLAPGTTPQVFIAYAEWEMSLEELRAKRCRRLRIRNSTSYKSQARVVQIFERGLVKHPGSLELWRSLLACLDLTGADKRWHKTMVRALRLHPGNAGLWVVAGKRYAERGDMQKGRGMFLRGCRFCIGRQALILWTEYARAEIEWLARTEKKLETGQHDVVQHSDEYLPVGGGDEDSEDEDFIKFDDDDDEFPVPTKEQKDLIDREVSKKLAQSPALSGAIPIAVFDVAKKQDFFDAHAAMAFWDIFTDATGISCRDMLLNHVMGYMTSHFNNHAETKYCHARMCLVGLKTGTPTWVKGINEALRSIAKSLQNLMLLGGTDELNKFMGLTWSWLGQLMDGVDKSSDIYEVLEGARERLQPTES